ncbi:MAG: hypothetical protein A3J49_07990 [Gallionellales bacterium RIFCSPHIGHO2_02_FULL_57_16]|nr:MAG: hypothetical protein A3J49_07990 [Gallionellales bacterium RIFCSPHIGHO2_02_FULL_57_16]
MQKLVSFVIDFWSYAFKGGPKYYSWLLFLSVFILVGLYTTYLQLTEGLILIGATDQITWELYISNFIFTAHVAAAAVLVVIPAYMYKRKDMKDLAVLGEIIALGFVTTGMVLVVYHVGRPDRLWHMIPSLGYFNFPNSMLTFDVVVLTVYMILNLIAAYYLFYKRYVGEPLNKIFYTPLIYVAVAWGPLIHIITAAVLSSNARMHAWSTAVLPFAFLSMAGASGPAVIIIIFLIIRKYTKLQIADSVIDLLSQIILWSLGILMLVFAAEFFTALYPSTEHAASLKYSMFGHNGLNAYVPWFWSIMILIAGSFIALLNPKIRKSYDRFLPAVCAVIFLVILLEKPYFLVFPAFSPSPLGEYTVYYPTFVEVSNVLFCWAYGFLVLTLTLKGAIGILTGEVTYTNRVPVSKEAAYAISP